MKITLTWRYAVILIVMATALRTYGQGVVTNVPPLPVLSDAEKLRFSAPDPDATAKLQAIWQEKQAALTKLTNGPIEEIVAELSRPPIGTVILWQHMPQATTNEINTFRKGWLVWWPPRFDVDYAILAKEPEAVLDRSGKAALFIALLHRDEARALDFLSQLRSDNPPTLQQACYAKAILEYQPMSNLFTKATAQAWKEILSCDNPLILGMALQSAPGRVPDPVLAIGLGRAANSEWMSLKYLAVEALRSLPKGKQRDALSHTIDPIRQSTKLPAVIVDALKAIEDAQPEARQYGSPAAGSPSGQP